MVPFGNSIPVAALAAAITLASSTLARAQELRPGGIWDSPDYVARSTRSRGAEVDSFSTGVWQGFNSSQPRAQWDPVDPSQPMVADGGPRPNIQPVAPPLVMFAGGYAPGTIVIDTTNRRLYHVNDNKTAYVYPISVGKEGFAWQGIEKVSRIAAWPDWYPPAEMRERRPELPEKMLGGVKNPLGAKAIYLGSTLYRIHGTDAPKTIGRAESSGCIRMLNENVVHLASLVNVGTEVIVTPELDPAAVVAAIPQPAPAARPAARQTASGDFFDTLWW